MFLLINNFCVKKFCQPPTKILLQQKKLRIAVHAPFCMWLEYQVSPADHAGQKSILAAILQFFKLDYSSGARFFYVRI